MGVVHLARRPGGERVALKMLRPHIVGDEEARQRLAREVGSLSRVRSAWVAEIVDADPWAEIPYVATRYVPGLSLHDHVLEEGRIEGDDLLWFAACLAEGVASVHEVGVLHRDIKPSNVLMEGRTPILIDFGLARVADDPKLTHTGWLLGTPGYLAPEILYGEDATTASDVHSWAATVAFAGTGRPPFGRGPSMAIMDRVRRGEHDLEGLPRQVGQVVTAALHPDPARRPTLPELLHWLRSGGTPVPPARVADVDAVTAPLAVAALAGADDVTAAGPTWADRRPAPTRAETQLGQPQPAKPAWPVPSRPVAERARGTALLLAGALAGGAAIAAYPYLATFTLVVLAWLLRSGSLAASAASTRRIVRGGRRRWYDAPQLLLATPWHLVQSIPGTLMLTLWGLGLATSAALLGYAAGVGLSWTLLVCGIAFTSALWLGPGGRRVRGPVSRVMRPLVAHTGAWLAATVLLLAGATFASVWVDTRGPDWAPADDHLLSGIRAGDLVPSLLR
jgi:Protein kinase domain